MSSSVLRKLLTLAWVGGWTVGMAALVRDPAYGLGPWAGCAVLFAPFGALLAIQVLKKFFAVRRPPEGAESPRSWGATPVSDEDAAACRRDWSECEKPVDDVLEKWRGRTLPERPRPRTPGDAKPAEIVFVDQERDRLATARQRLADVASRMVGRKDPAPAKWVRHEGVICGVLGQRLTGNTLLWRLRTPFNVEVWADDTRVSSALPKKGERWVCKPCPRHAGNPGEFVIDREDDKLATELVACGCLEPVNASLYRVSNGAEKEGDASRA